MKFTCTWRLSWTNGKQSNEITHTTLWQLPLKDSTDRESAKTTNATTGSQWWFWIRMFLFNCHADTRTDRTMCEQGSLHNNTDNDNNLVQSLLINSQRQHTISNELPVAFSVVLPHISWWRTKLDSNRCDGSGNLAGHVQYANTKTNSIYPRFIPKIFALPSCNQPPSGYTPSEVAYFDKAKFSLQRMERVGTAPLSLVDPLYSGVELMDLTLWNSNRNSRFTHMTWFEVRIWAGRRGQRKTMDVSDSEMCKMVNALNVAKTRVLMDAS